jgi:hypothetical protein
MVNYLAKPPGYRNPFNGIYNKPYNKAILGNQAYAPGAPIGLDVTFTFTAAPANLSTITIPDDNSAFNPGAPRLYTFTYSGAPGTGVIPLVAGGGTAAQAAAAAAQALGVFAASKLLYWTVSNPTATSLRLVSQLKGKLINIVLGGVTNMTTVVNQQAGFAPILPGRFGKNYCFLNG